MTLRMTAADAVKVREGGRDFFKRCFVIVAQEGDKAFRDGQRDAAPYARFIGLRPCF